MHNINIEIENQIFDGINIILDQYLDGRTIGTRHASEILHKDDYDTYFENTKRTLKDARRDFNKPKNLKNLIIDIKYPGYQLFKIHSQGENDNIDLDYQHLIKTILNTIIIDRIALEKDNKKINNSKNKKNKKIMENIKLFGNFDKFDNSEKLNEIKLPIVKIEEILDNVNKVTNDTFKGVLVSFYNTYVEYIDLVDKDKHQFKVNDMVGDILNNNRISFDSVIFDKNDIIQIKKNIVDFSIGEFYTTLPTNVNVFGLDLKPSSFINKEELKFTFENAVTFDNVIEIISSMLQYKYEKQFNDFYIWSNKK